MSQVLIAIVDDEEPVRDATKALCDLWATTTFPRLARPMNFSNPTRFTTHRALITDVQMSGLSGIDLQDHLIARGHRIPIIFMTGYPNDSVRARAMKGRGGLLPKQAI